MMFADYWQTSVENDQFLRLGRMLGTYWTKEDIDGIGSKMGDSKIPEFLNVPLLLGMQPTVMEAIKKVFLGLKAQDEAPEWVESADSIEDLYATDKDSFMKVVNSFLAPTLARTGVGMKDEPTDRYAKSVKQANSAGNAPKNLPVRKIR